MAKDTPQSNAELSQRLHESSEYLAGMAEGDRDLAPWSVTSQNSVTLGITAALEEASKACAEAAAALIAADKREREIEKLTLDANRLWRWGRDGAIYVRLEDLERILNTGSEATDG